MGAAAALAMAVRWPERCQALILSRPAWAEDGMSQEAQQALALVAELLSAKDWRETATQQLERSEILASLDEVCPDAARSLRQQVRSVLRCPENRRSRIACLRKLPFSGGFDELDRDLGRVHCPTLVLAAEGDPIHPVSFAVRIAEALPNSRLVGIKPKSVRDERSHLQEVDQQIGEFVGSLLLSPAATDEVESGIDGGELRIQPGTDSGDDRRVRGTKQETL